MSGELASVDLNLLVPLEALLRERSVTRAAEQVGLSQPAMSNALGRLRRLLGDDLLIRNGNQLELTPRAVQLIGPLQDTLGLVEHEILNPASFDPASSSRVFSISASDSTALVVYPRLIRDFATVAPRMGLRAHPQSIRQVDALLRRPGIDLVLLPDVAPTSMPRTRLYNEKWVCVVAAGNDRVGSTLSLREFAELPHAAYGSDGLRTHADLALEAAGALPRVQVEVEDFMLIPFLLEGTDLVAVLQERVALRLAETTSIRILELPLDTVSPLGIDMVWNPRAASDPACQWLRSRLVDMFAEAGGPPGDPVV